MIEYAMSQHTVIQDAKLDDILESRDWTKELLTGRYDLSF